MSDSEQVAPDMMGDVAAFHRKFGQQYEGPPRVLPTDLFDFRVNFHYEETSEYQDEQPPLVEELVKENPNPRVITDGLELQLDALADSAWVLLGTADLQFGAERFREAWRRVVVANMSKVLGTSDPDAQETGRDIKYDIRKPPGWKPPSHRDLVYFHAHRPCEDKGCPEYSPVSIHYHKE